MVDTGTALLGIGAALAGAEAAGVTNLTGGDEGGGGGPPGGGGIPPGIVQALQSSASSAAGGLDAGSLASVLSSASGGGGVTVVERAAEQTADRVRERVTGYVEGSGGIAPYGAVEGFDGFGSDDGTDGVNVKPLPDTNLEAPDVSAEGGEVDLSAFNPVKAARSFGRSRGVDIGSDITGLSESEVRAVANGNRESPGQKFVDGVAETLAGPLDRGGGGGGSDSTPTETSGYGAGRGPERSEEKQERTKRPPVTRPGVGL